MHYLYRHIRLDTNKPFYIGIGTKKKINNFNQEYYRAFNKSRRNPYWKNIVKKTDYEVEIIFESSNYDLIKQKEQEFISLYGLENLSNMTLGGEGTLGYYPTEEHRAKLREKRKYRKMPSKKVFQYSLSDEYIREWDSCTEAAKVVGCTKATLCKAANGKSKTCKGFKWRSVCA